MGVMGDGGGDALVTMLIFIHCTPQEEWKRTGGSIRRLEHCLEPNAIVKCRRVLYCVYLDIKLCAHNMHKHTTQPSQPS